MAGYGKGDKCIGSKTLSSPDGVKDVTVPGGHATPERRAARDFSKRGINAKLPEFDDVAERAKRFGF